MKRLIFLLPALAGILAFTVLRSDNPVLNGTEVPVFGGKVWSKLSLTKEGKPAQLSLVFDEAVLQSSPTGPHANPDHMANTFIVPLSEEAKKASPFEFIMLNWNPSGHEPEHVYTVPHFDVHFYIRDAAEVMGYTDSVKLDTDPEASYLPAGHVGVHPMKMMGKHWVDTASPELKGAAFTETFIYGSYNAELIFFEPMITLDFLKKTSSYERQLPQPAKFQESGYYPTTLKVTKQNGKTEVTLAGFTYREAS
ncbi:MAG: hypothetical protein ACO1OO_02515 [Flavisolibacter sp.]